MKTIPSNIVRVLCLILLTSTAFTTGCATNSPQSRKAHLEDKGKLAIVPLRDAEKGERLDFDELGFRFIPHEAYTANHLKLEECDSLEQVVLAVDVSASQPLTRAHFQGL